MDIADFLDRKQAEKRTEGMSRNEILEIESHAVGRTGSYASGRGQWHGFAFTMKGNPKDPDGTLVRQDFAGRNQREWKSDWWRSVNRTPEFFIIREGGCMSSQNTVYLNLRKSRNCISRIFR